MRSSVAGSKGSTQWKRAVRPSSRSGMTGRARTSGGSDAAPVPNHPTLFGPRSRLRRRGGGSLRSRLAPGRAMTKRRRWGRSVRGRNDRLDADAVEVSDAHAGRMSAKATRFDAPSPFERVFSRLFGMLVGLGLALPHNYLLQVHGRKSGRLYSTPVDVLEHGGRRFLVAGRGETQWVRNARASGQVTLRKGLRGEACRLRALSDAEKPEVLNADLAPL